MQKCKTVPLVIVSALCSIQCFNADSWLTGRTYRP